MKLFESLRRRRASAYALRPSTTRPDALSLAPDASATVPDSISATLWREYIESPDSHPQVPNISYAGYRRGEKPLPRPAGPVFDVRDHGAVGDGAADDTEAFRTALRAAGAHGGGVVYVGPGDYAVSGVLWVHHSHVVLRGAGTDQTRIYFRCALEAAYRKPRKGEWSWTGGLIWFIPDVIVTRLEESGWGWGAHEGWVEEETTSPIRGPVARGSAEVPVDDPERFAPGDHVLLVLDSPEDSSLLRHMCGDLPDAAYAWGTDDASLHRQPNYRTFRWPVQIQAVHEDSVELAQPTRLDLRPTWNPRLAPLGPRVEESGVEDLTCEMSMATPRRHNEDYGFNGPHFQASLNCWARNVVVRHSDNAFGLTSSKGVTLCDVIVEGRARHHPFICREQSHDNLVQNFTIDAPSTELPEGARTHGLNIEGYSSGNVWSGGTMVGTFDSHRRFPFDNVRTEITIKNTGNIGGAQSAGPHWAARFCHWNISLLNDRPYAVCLENHAPYSAMVGIRGASRPWRQKTEFAGDIHSVTEAMDSVPTPRNLYNAQVRHRLGRWPVTNDPGRIHA